jgi:succinyl-diaminopimelate desuccinylase
VDERVLTERLVTYDTSTAEGLHAAAGFVKGWLEARDIEVEAHKFGDLHALTAAVGPDGARTLVLHGHLDVVPGHAEQFVPRVEGDRLYGRGAYDMKGGLAAMMCAAHDLVEQRDVRVRLVIVPDEESEDIECRSSDTLVRRGYVGDFAITGEPTNMHIGVQAKGVLACRILVSGRAAHGSTPWLGDNAIVKAVDVFRRIESLPFSRESSELFDRPSINLGRAIGGDAPNKVPDACVMDVDIRYLPEQDPDEILEAIRTIPDVEVKRTFVFPPAHVSRSNPYVRALSEALGPVTHGASVSVGRDGASDAVSFLRAGIPAVEFGPAGSGHHGPEEWVSISSLARYRRLLVDFARRLAAPVRALEDVA